MQSYRKTIDSKREKTTTMRLVQSTQTSERHLASIDLIENSEIEKGAKYKKEEIVVIL